MGINGERLRKLREERGLFPSDVAKFLGVTRTAYVKYESGDTKTPRQIDKLAQFFHVSTDYLLGNDSPLFPSAQNGELARFSDQLTHDEMELLNAYRVIDDEEKPTVLHVLKKLAAATLATKSKTNAK